MFHKCTNVTISASVPAFLLLQAGRQLFDFSKQGERVKLILFAVTHLHDVSQQVIARTLESAHL